MTREWKKPSALSQDGFYNSASCRMMFLGFGSIAAIVWQGSEVIAGADLAMIRAS